MPPVVKHLGGCAPAVADIHDQWRRKKFLLQSKFCYPGLDGRVRSWLVASNENPADGPLKLGCRLCLKLLGPAAAVKSRTLAAFPTASPEMLRVHKLMRHEQQKQHLKAVEMLTGDGGCAPFAPSKEAFKKVWSDVRRRNQDADFKEKERIISWCLAESIRHFQRQHLKKSTCISLSQDASQTRQLIRFASVDDKFECITGVLGPVKNVNTTSSV